jgi:hypothetical protein
MVLILIVLIKQEKISELQYSIMYIARDYICSWQLNSSGSKFQLQFLVSQLKPAGTSGSVENTVYVLTDKQTDRQLERHGQTDKHCHKFLAMKGYNTDNPNTAVN